jgi:hypothetical protein
MGPGQTDSKVRVEATPRSPDMPPPAAGLCRGRTVWAHVMVSPDSPRVMSCRPVRAPRLRPHAQDGTGRGRGWVTDTRTRGALGGLGAGRIMVCDALGQDVTLWSKGDALRQSGPDLGARGGP